MISKIKILKTADLLIGGLAVSLLKFFHAPKSNTENKISNILVIRPGGIGDAVLLIPGIMTLKKNLPGAKIDILAEKRNSEIFGLCSLVDNVYLYDDLKSLGLKKIFNCKYDAVIDTEQCHKLTSVVAFLTKAPVRIGYSTNGREHLYSHSVDYLQGEYEAVSFLNLVSALTGKKHRFNTKGGFLDTGSNIKVDVFTEYKNRFKTIIGIFAGATVKERKWGVRKFSMLAENFLATNIGVVILGGRNDLSDSDQFGRILGNRDYLNLIGKTSLIETAAIISRLDLLVSADSGLMHIAYGVGTKTLSLFGAGIEQKWAPGGADNYVINRNLPCSPCTRFGYTPGCPIGVKCLAEISAGEVYDLALKILNTKL